MKNFYKKVFGTLCLACLLAFCPSTAMAQEFEVNGLKYKLVDGICEVAQQDRKTIVSVVEIPKTVEYEGESYTVTKIGKRAFYACANMTGVEIPNSITIIGEEAFYWCKGLTSIEIPNSVTSIGKDALSNCFSILSIEIPNSVTSIGDEAFSNCESLSSIVIPNSVTSIGKYAFYGCSSLASIEIPNSITSIADATFSGVDLWLMLLFQNL